MSSTNTKLRSIVTGGTGALGSAIIAAMKARGDEVVCLDMRRPEQDDVAFIEVDVSNRASVNEALDEAVQFLGGIDSLVHSAGIIKTSKFCDLNEQDFLDVVDVNLLGAFRVAQQASRHMADHGGRIVLVTSIHGQIGVPGRGAYAAAKGGIASLARVMAAELAERRIRVNVLAPGAVDGGMLVDPRSREGWVSATPSKRVAYLKEVAGVAAMLTSEDASFVNGQIVAVDGGVSTVRAFNH
ncbi:SDR family NAD(P)-dependent oxidoreductase [Algirhabdus cladophorae]|uniref:SDR family NAD(P)-dependent oxidoreductase n=1 Tax=Algirhabdus cladophorae TaxID=3377108 RepID=UPI003B846CA1